MRILIIISIYICAVTISCGQALLGKGTVKISLNASSLLVNGVKVYPGDELKFTTDGTVRKNWWVEKKESCFLWFCDKYEIVHNNFHNPNSLPATLYIKSSDGTSVKPTGFELKEGELTVAIPDIYAYDKPFELFGFFPDPSINRSKSDGEYMVNVSISFAGRFMGFKAFLRASGNSLTYSKISSKDVISDLFAEAYGAQIATLVLGHLEAHPAIPASQRKEILQFLYSELNSTNPALSLAIAKNALQTYDLTTANQAIQNAKALLSSSTASEEQKADAHGLMGYYLLALHEQMQDRGTMLEASSNFGSAAELYFKNSMYDSAIRAYYKQATSLRRLGGTGYLQESLEILTKAERLTSKLLAITKNNQYGLVSILGASIVPPSFEQLRPSDSYLIPAKKNSKWGFIDKTGRVVVQPIYDEVGEFKEGFTWGRSGQDYVYIDTKGENPFPEKFRFTSDFHRNFAFVLASDGIFYFINRKGNKFAVVNENHLNTIACGDNFPNPLIHPPGTACDLQTKLKILRENRGTQFFLIGTIASRFFNGLTIAPFNKTGEPLYDPSNAAIGFIDKSGEIVRAADPNITGFQLNKNTYYLFTRSNFAKVLNVNALKEIALPPSPKPSTVWVLGNGGLFFSYNDKPNLYGLINDQNKIVKQPQYFGVSMIDASLTFVANDQHFAALKQDGSALFQFPSENSFVEWAPCCGFYQNALGQPPQGNPSDKYTFSNFLHVRLRDKLTRQIKKSMVINKVDGSLFVQDSFDWLGYLQPERDLFAVAKLNDAYDWKYGIYKAGQGFLLPCDYDGLEIGISNDFGIAYRGEKYQLVDYENESLSDWSYDSLSFYSEELLIAKANGMYGVVSLTNETIVPFEYSDLSNLNSWQYFPILAYHSTPQPLPSLYHTGIKLRSRIASFTQNGKDGVISVTDGKPIVNAAYDYIVYLDDKLLGINYKIKADDKDYYTFSIHSYFGNKFIDDTFIYLRYDETDKTFIGITDKKQLKVFTANGKVLLSAPIIIEDGDIFRAVLQGKYVVDDAQLTVNKQELLKGPIKKFVKLTNRIILQTSSKLLIISMDSGYIKQADADNVLIDGM